jgi:hypothetical protein
MTTVMIPGPCPYCQGTKFARITSFAVALVPMHPPSDASKSAGAEVWSLAGQLLKLSANIGPDMLARDARDEARDAYRAAIDAANVVDKNVLFALIMCTRCGKADWFSQNPAYLVERFGEDAKLIELPAAEPYR